MLTSGARLEQKNGVLELTKLEYPKKWYFPTYFANSVFGPNISTIDANGPFWPSYHFKFLIHGPSSYILNGELKDCGLEGK